MKSILNTEVSCFANCSSVAPADVNLLSWLTSGKYRDKIEQIRNIQDEELQKKIKKTLPAITPSGVFSERSIEHLVSHTGFLAFDIDFADNTHISNFNELKEQVSHVVCVAYCGLSCRGKGFWGLVPIPKSTPAEHTQRFNALSKFFKSYNINLDPICSDISRLRIYSHDDNAYFNHNAKVYTSILKPKRKLSVRPVYTDTRERVEAVINLIKADKTDITEVYDNWMKIASAFENEFGEDGRGYFHVVSQYHLKYDSSETDYQFDAAQKHNNGKVKIGSFFHIAADYGIRLKQTEFIKPDEIPIIKKEHSSVITLQKVERIVKPVSNEVIELERFFSSVQLPDKIKLDQCTMITDVHLFVKSHIDIMKAQDGNKKYIPYMERLKLLKDLLN
jgi:hypothetical protein